MSCVGYEVILAKVVMQPDCTKLLKNIFIYLHFTKKNSHIRDFLKKYKFMLNKLPYILICL
jgi:hypothetical protein